MQFLKFCRELHIYCSEYTNLTSFYLSLNIYIIEYSKFKHDRLLLCSSGAVEHGFDSEIFIFIKDKKKYKLGSKL